MANRLILLEEADKEYQEAAKWYEAAMIVSVYVSLTLLKKKLKIIQQFSERYAKTKANFREAPVKVFPYIIVYTFYKTKKIITINSIFHTSRNPRMKYNREK